MFSSRLDVGAGRNRLARAVDSRHAAGLPVLDLTASNPTRAEFAYPPGLLAPLSHAEALRYVPAPFGLPVARKAVADDYCRRGTPVPPERILLTASTSEAYSMLFKLLCDPGDSVLVPRPSYPLVEHLAALDAVTMESFPLDFDGRWRVEPEMIEERLKTGRKPVRALVLVSPNNPTGSVLRREEVAAVASIAVRYDVTLIVDEVFCDYPMIADWPPSAVAENAALTFALGGLSKSVGLPQVKLAWMAVNGPEPVVTAALDRLETIADAYLSVSTPVQLAVPDLLRDGAVVRQQIHDRVRDNLAILGDMARRYPSCTLLPVEGGWYAVLQVPAVESEEELVLRILDSAGVLVHPGYFFDFDREAFLVISLLPPTELFVRAIASLFGLVARA